MMKRGNQAGETVRDRGRRLRKGAKRMGSGAAAVILALALALPVSAASQGPIPVDSDPQRGRAGGEISADFFGRAETEWTGVQPAEDDDAIPRYGETARLTPAEASAHSHDERFADTEVHNGIDVSRWQGNIDWNAVREDGIEFAFIRVGYRGSTEGGLGPDILAEQNLADAAAAGVKVGAYIFSQAISVEEAVAEAEFALEMIRGYDVTMPIVMDYEYESSSGGNGGRLYEARGSLGKDGMTAVVNAFAARIWDAGYTPMIYANKSMLRSWLNADQIDCPIWLAHYIEKTDYTGDYTCWQYTSSGEVAGISGRVDLDFWYGELAASEHPYNGYYEGVDYTAVFDPAEYLSYNADLEAAFPAGTPSREARLLRHFVQYGMDEGRRGNAEFDLTYYMEAEQNADLRAAFGDNKRAYYLHYISDGKAEGRAGSREDIRVPGMRAMLRLYNESTGEHFFTAEEEERDTLVGSGWIYEGIAWYAPEHSEIPVYRLYNPYVQGGDHHYTTNAGERDFLVEAGWVDEGIGWYSSAELDAGARALFRLYNPNAVTGMHHYTQSVGERDALVESGWMAEGVGWYGRSAE